MNEPNNLKIDSNHLIETAFYKNDEVEYRKLILNGTYLNILVCNNLGLSLNIFVTSSHLFFMYCYHYNVAQEELKFITGACILLAWKFHEDLESYRSNRKILDLSRVIYRLCELIERKKKGDEKNDIDLNVSASAWIYSDSGKDLSNYCEVIRTYEIALLRAIKYKLPRNINPMSNIQIYTKLLLYLPCESGINNSSRIEKKHLDIILASDCMLKNILNLTYSIMIEIFRLPDVCLCYSCSEIALGTIWLSGMLLGYVELFSKSWYTKICKNIKKERIISCINEIKKVLQYIEEHKFDLNNP